MKRCNYRLLAIFVIVCLLFTPLFPFSATAYGAEKQHVKIVSSDNGKQDHGKKDNGRPDNGKSKAPKEKHDNKDHQTKAQKYLLQERGKPAMPRDKIAPAAPTGMTAVAGDQSVTLTWDANAEPDLACYRLEYQAANANNWKKLVSTDTTATITGLTNDVQYNFRIKAKDIFNNWSVYSSYVSAMPSALMVYGQHVTLIPIEGGCGENHLQAEGAFTHTVEFMVDENPVTAYAVETPSQLQHMALHLSDDFVLLYDLDFSEIPAGIVPGTPLGDLNAAAASIGGTTSADLRIEGFAGGNFVPVGYWANENSWYRGTFYGNDKTIKGLNISGDAMDYVGLFGSMSEGSARDLTLDEGTVEGGNNVGGLAGDLQSGSIINISNSNAVTGNASVGGVVGNCNAGSIKSSGNSGTVTGVETVGGVVGYKYGNLLSSNNSGTVNGNHIVGGVIGYSDGGFTGSYNSGTITGVNAVGGVIGMSYGGGGDAYNSGTVIGSYGVGGVIGDNYVGMTSDLINEGTVSGIGGVGGIAGYNGCHTVGCDILRSFNTGTIIGTSSSVGGIAGANGCGEVADSYNNGAIAGLDYVGGLIGSNRRGNSGEPISVIDSYNTGAVSGRNYVGGATGFNDGVISNVYNTGAISGNTYIGGVVGFNECIYPENSGIDAAYNSGVVDGALSVGGVIGYNYMYSSDATATGFWMSGMNLANSDGIGSNEYGIDGTVPFDYDDSILLAMYANMATITESADGTITGSVVDMAIDEDMTPSYNSLQGSYISASCSTLIVIADTGSSIAYATGSSLADLIGSNGADAAGTGGVYTIDISTGDGPWIIIKAESENPNEDRVYAIYLK